MDIIAGERKTKEKKCIRVKSTKLLTPGNVFQIPAFYEQKIRKLDTGVALLCGQGGQMATQFFRNE